MVRKLLAVSVSLLCLAIAYQLGTRTAAAQGAGNQIVGICGITNSSGFLEPYVVTQTGDVYRGTNAGQSWQLRGNVFTGAPTPAQQESWGALKARVR